MISKGSVNIVNRSNEVLAQRVAGEFLGENSLLDTTPAGATCITADFCEIFLLPRIEFERLMAKHPEFLERIKFFSKHKDEASHQAAYTKQLKFDNERKTAMRDRKSRVHSTDGESEGSFDKGSSFRKRPQRYTIGSRASQSMRQSHNSRVSQEESFTKSSSGGPGRYSLQTATHWKTLRSSLTSQRGEDRPSLPSPPDSRRYDDAMAA